MTYNEPQDVVLQQETFTSAPVAPTFYTVNTSPQMQAQNVLTNDQSYGKQGDTIDASIGLRNIPVGTLKTKTGNASVPGSTGAFSVTGVGFKPSVVRIVGTHAGAGSCGMCDGVMTSTHSAYRDLYFNNAGSSAIPYVGTNTGIVLFLQDPYNTTRAVYQSMDDDGFTLNFTSVALTGCTFIWEALA